MVDQLSIIDSLSASCLGSASEIKYHAGADQGPQGRARTAALPPHLRQMGDHRRPSASFRQQTSRISQIVTESWVPHPVQEPARICTNSAQVRRCLDCFASLHLSRSGAFGGESSQEWVSLFCQRASEAQATASHDLAAGVRLKSRLGGQANRCFNQRIQAQPAYIAGGELKAQSHSTICKPSRL